MPWQFPKEEPLDRPRALTFAPLAWLKLQYFCHAGETEVGGFGISHEKDPLYIEDFRTIPQVTTMASVKFLDQAVADYFDVCVDQGLAFAGTTARFGRIWLHTHPGSSPQPSSIDEETFARVFGSCDWALMFILSRTARTYARLAFSAGPGGHLLLPVQVDWAAWPQQAGLKWDAQAWSEEYAQNVQDEALLKSADLLQGPFLEDLANDPWYPGHPDLADSFARKDFHYEQFS